MVKTPIKIRAVMKKRPGKVRRPAESPTSGEGQHLMDLDIGAERVRIPLPAALNTSDSASLRATLIEAAKKGLTVAIDAADVERMSTACIQVLLSAGKTYQDQGTDFVLSRPSDAFIADFNDLGLFSILMGWTVES